MNATATPELVGHIHGDDTKLLFDAIGQQEARRDTVTNIVLTRERGQAVIIDDEIRVEVRAIRGGRVRLAIQARQSIPIDREEVHEGKPKPAGQRNPISLDGWTNVGEFASYVQWVNTAASWIGSISRGRNYAVLCIDTKNRPCFIGADFMRSRDDNAFPVSYYVRNEEIGTQA